MVYLYNTSTTAFKDIYRHAYNSLAEYMLNESDDAEHCKILFVISMDNVFNRAKERTAYRARFAKDPSTGKSLLDHLVISDDERDYFDDQMRSGAADVFAKLSAWAKDTANAFKFNVTFGVVSSEGTIGSVSGNVLTDSSQSLAADALIGHTLVIVSSGDYLDQEAEVTDNTETTLTLAAPFSGDITGQSFKTYDPSKKHILYDIKMSLDWDANMIERAETAISEALITYFIWQWYLINRYLDDANVELVKYKEELLKIREALSQRKTPLRRSGEIFS